MHTGNCVSCTLERELADATNKCRLCTQREEAAEATHAPSQGAAGADMPMPEQLAPAAASAEPHVVAEMHIKLLSNGDGTIEGPLQDRKTILTMLNVAHDLSYEYEKRALEAAALANRPAPKKWSKAWWKEEFRRRDERKAEEQRVKREQEAERELARATQEAARQGGKPH